MLKGSKDAEFLIRRRIPQQGYAQDIQGGYQPSGYGVGPGKFIPISTSGTLSFFICFIRTHPSFPKYRT